MANVQERQAKQAQEAAATAQTVLEKSEKQWAQCRDAALHEQEKKFQKQMSDSADRSNQASTFPLLLIPLHLFVLSGARMCLLTIREQGLMT